MKMKKEVRSESDAARYNGEAHGVLYSPEKAVDMKTRDKKKIEEQGELYSPPHQINQMEDGDDAAKSKQEEEAYEEDTRRDKKRSLSKL